MSAPVDALLLYSTEAGRVASLAQTHDDGSDPGAPAAAVREQSRYIVQSLAGLLDDAEGQLKTVRDTESQNLNAFEMMEQGINDEIKFGKKELQEAQIGSATASEVKAKAEGDHKLTAKELATTPRRSRTCTTSACPRPRTSRQRRRAVAKS